MEVEYTSEKYGAHHNSRNSGRRVRPAQPGSRYVEFKIQTCLHGFEACPDCNYLQSEGPRIVPHDPPRHAKTLYALCAVWPDGQVHSLYDLSTVYPSGTTLLQTGLEPEKGALLLFDSVSSAVLKEDRRLLRQQALADQGAVIQVARVLAWNSGIMDLPGSRGARKFYSYIQLQGTVAPPPMYASLLVVGPQQPVQLPGAAALDSLMKLQAQQEQQQQEQQQAHQEEKEKICAQHRSTSATPDVPCCTNEVQGGSRHLGQASSGCSRSSLRGSGLARWDTMRAPSTATSSGSSHAGMRASSHACSSQPGLARTSMVVRPRPSAVALSRAQEQTQQLMKDVEELEAMMKLTRGI